MRVRPWATGDEDLIGKLWEVEAAAGRAVERESAGLIFTTRPLWKVAEVDSQMLAAFRNGPVHPRIPEGLIHSIRTCLAGDETADYTLLAYITEEARDDRCVSVQVWRLNTQSGAPRRLGFHKERMFWRLDRDPLPLVAPDLPEGFTVITSSDPRANHAEWVDLYNRAFEGEWLFWPEDINTWAKVTANRIVVAAIDPSNKPVGLVISQVNLLLSTHERANPVGEVLVLCTAPEWRGRKIAKNLMSLTLSRFAMAGVRTVSILADTGSQHESFRIYQRWGFKPAVEWEIWERRID